MQRSSPVAWCNQSQMSVMSSHSRSRSGSGRDVSFRLQMDWIQSVGRSMANSARIQQLAQAITSGVTTGRSQPSAVQRSGNRGVQTRRFQARHEAWSQETVRNANDSQRRASHRRQRAWEGITEELEVQHQDRLQLLRDLAVEYQPPEDVEAVPCSLSDAISTELKEEIFSELKEEMVAHNLPQIHGPFEPGAVAAEGCGICLEAYKQFQRTKQLPCGHRFHRECLWSWFQRKLTCPTCRFDCSNHCKS